LTISSNDPLIKLVKCIFSWISLVTTRKVPSYCLICTSWWSSHFPTLLSQHEDQSPLPRSFSTTSRHYHEINQVIYSKAD